MNDATQTSSTRSRARSASSPPLLEWLAGAFGLAIVVATIAFLAYQAITHEPAPPALTVSIEGIAGHEGGYVVEVAVRNASGSTAAEVEIEGTLSDRGRVIERSTARLDYVPGNSAQRAGLMFRGDPARRQLSVRAVGYREP